MEQLITVNTLHAWMLNFKYSAINSFFKKFSDSLKLGFYIWNINLVIQNFSCNIVIIIQTFRTETEKLVFVPY